MPYIVPSEGTTGEHTVESLHLPGADELVCGDVHSKYSRVLFNRVALVGNRQLLRVEHYVHQSTDRRWN